ncbi:hypothetical protein [Ferroacidibacillus organovorans]|uniref:hypothetical protein n=1 Tax=Ferroacidibacillus organovorans TaxID=1765683 RepID=UPI0007A8F39B|nr:hypothetical protein [Ferroacidibacillus organovorans]KYP82007.1 hypothetical protein AYJ22_15525 [Ferroacidibacillus organovorans]
MKKHPVSLTDQIPASARALVEQFDETKRKGSSFEKQHVRQTFWVRRDLAKRVDELCKTRKGFKTQFVNYALERCLEEVMRDETRADRVNETVAEPMMPSKDGVSKELTRQEVEQILYKKNADEACRAKAWEWFFPDQRDQTKLWNSEKNTFSHENIKIGNGLRKFQSAQGCIEYFIKQYPYWRKIGNFKA